MAVQPIGRRAARRRVMSGIRGEASARLALETTLMNPEQTLKGSITVGSNQALVSGRLQSFLDTSDKVVLTEWLV